MKISIVIATMNRPITLQETLESIQKSNELPDEIIIVDQSQDNSTRNMLKKFKSLNILYHHTTPSLTKARNIGLDLIQNNVVIFMDDDVNIQVDTIRNIKEIMKNQTISMIAGNNLNSDNTKRGSLFGYLFFRKKLFKKNVGYVTDAMFGRLPQNLTDRVTTEWAMGFFFVVRKSLIKSWHNEWDENLVSYAYPEDLDFSYRYFLNSKRHGYQCIMDPSVQVYHMASKEWRLTSWKTTLMLVINREYLSYKLEKGFLCRLKIRWSNFGIFLMRLLKKDNYKDMILAQYYCDKYRKDIKHGVLHTELYDKK